jgi:N-acetylglutamate synthase-like GNAT family acetyltransferase
MQKCIKPISKIILLSAALKSEYDLVRPIIIVEDNVAPKFILYYQLKTSELSKITKQICIEFNFDRITTLQDWQFYYRSRVVIESAYGITAFQVYYMIKRMKLLMKKFNIIWYFLERQGVKVGAIGIYYFSFENINFVRLQDIDIFPEFRRFGYGNSLLDLLLLYMLEQKIQHIFVGAEQNDWPITWYQRRGFQKICGIKGLNANGYF